MQPLRFVASLSGEGPAGTRLVILYADGYRLIDIGRVLQYPPQVFVEDLSHCFRRPTLIPFGIQAFHVQIDKCT